MQISEYKNEGNGTECALEPIRPDTRRAAVALLEQFRLPTADLDASQVELIVATAASEVVGVVGLEVRGGDGLLRSLAVKETARNQRVGRKLIDAVMSLGRERQLKRLYLLTTTAADYFARLGFAATARETVPEPVRATAEFTSLCPSTAALMVREL
ncbi:MAG: arsenic resistance N-acetyltransferase ArsN2 [Archangium sp.]